MFCHKRSHCSEKPIQHNERVAPLSAARESPCAATKTQCDQKQINYFKTDILKKHQFSSVQLLSRVWLFVTPWTAACQGSLSITNFWSLLKLMSIKLVMSFDYLILCRTLLLLPSILPSIRCFLMSQLFQSNGRSIGVSASVFPMNI